MDKKLFSDPRFLLASWERKIEFLHQHIISLFTQDYHGVWECVEAIDGSEFIDKTPDGLAAHFGHPVEDKALLVGFVRNVEDGCSDLNEFFW